MTGKEIALAFRNGDYVYGTAILSPSTVWPRIVGSLGLDMVFIDTEHTPLNRETVSWMCSVYSRMNLAPIVRIPSPDPYQATMALDAGASGIIAPYIETAEQVRKLAGAVKHKPVKGEKLYRLLSSKKQFEPELSDYLNNLNQECVLIVNIESVPAIEALDEILKVDGLDAVLVGPHDLSCNLGIPEQYDHPRFKESVETIIRKARDHNVGAGVHMWEAVGYDQEIQWARSGANFIMHASDIALFKEAMQRDMQRLRDALDDSPVDKKNGEAFTV